MFLPKFLSLQKNRSIFGLKNPSCDRGVIANAVGTEFIPKLLLRCGLFAWTRFRIILRNVLALSGL